MALKWHPYDLYGSEEVRFWVHYGLVILGAVLAGVTVVVQWRSPAPYGKHERRDQSWGPMIPQRLGHILSDALPGVALFTLVFVFYGTENKTYVNYVFLAMFLSHYIHRGLIHPLIMRYRNPKVALGITLGGFFPNCLYHFVNADFTGSAEFHSDYFYDPRFLVGVILFCCGYIINRYSDFKLRSLREMKGCTGYYIPYGGFFELVSCPNYFGELVEWTGWTLATWSGAGLVWTLFSAATFIPRARHNHAWYKSQFDSYPPNRKCLIPFLF
ncbi:3-oxo-5-alpha-steroid 4-dehydrogenase 1-like isoform X2 [Crassostrea virginica]|uniref:3-oxo-5-alpha-steroid 4-dehydrogenase 1-like isoform X2 n=1 Tax=Crassostrea virginica TaxID=6565 RepID=A0A8B8C0Q8_CRAVI|nr:3-oxo-5-alpha-steroid 4-dehydrogenase 1-like isoform X2 [Crassostrea virginica]